MSWRTIVITGNAKLDLKLGFLVVRKETTAKVHLSEVHTIIIDSCAVSLTTALISELVNRKIKVVFCDETHNPAGELLPCRGCHDTSLKIRLQMKWSDEQKEAVWTEIVAEKIRKQKMVLDYYHHVQAGELLEQYIEELELGDATNREGHAAKVYFNTLFGKDFTRSDDNIVNAALNYGYTIILSTFNREIVSNGYLTQIGLYHDNRFNPFNLGSDLMEPFRVLIDLKVYESGFEVFEHEQKMEMLDVLNYDLKIGGKKQKLQQAIKIYCRSVFDALNEGDITKIQFYQYEL